MVYSMFWDIQSFMPGNFRPVYHNVGIRYLS